MTLGERNIVIAIIWPLAWEYSYIRCSDQNNR